MRQALAIAASLVVLAGCAGPDAPADGDGQRPAAAPEQAACLSGQVVSEEALPVRLAQATLNGTSTFNLTDAEGRFELCVASAGAHSLEVLAKGYRPWHGDFTLPAEDVRVVLVEVPPPTRRIEVLPYTLFYEVGFTTLDSTIGREVNSTTCSPCSFSVLADDVPDILYLEADWTRTVMPPDGSGDIMYHILRAGAPFEAGEDIGSGAKSKPFAFNYPRHELVESEAARQDDGSWAFSGAIYCAGNAPCVDQRIDVYVSLLYEYEAVPAGYTALPGT